MGFTKTALLAFFISHIPITLLIDAQILLPVEWFPSPVRGLILWYIEEAKDPFLAGRPLGCQCFVACELLLQLPFFFIAVNALLSNNLASIRTLSLIYAAHVCTTVIPLVAELVLKKYPADEVGPRTSTERAILISLYAPYFIFPALLAYTVYPMQEEDCNSATTKRVKAKRT